MEEEDNYTEALKSAYIMLFPPGISKLPAFRFLTQDDKCCFSLCIYIQIYVYIPIGCLQGYVSVSILL